MSFSRDESTSSPPFSPSPIVGGTRLRTPKKRESPLVSILAVAFNDRDEVGELIENIAPFRSEDLELVIIDGGSRDGTAELLRSRDEKIDYWLCESDRGIYDGMNKGLTACSGAYVLHLNAGDRLVQIPWDLLHRCSSSKVDVVSCGVLIDDCIEFLPRTDLISKIDNTWHHQGTFYLSATHPGYDTTYRICGDFDHNQRRLRSGCSVEMASLIVATHRSGGVSMDSGARPEILRSVRANFGLYYLLLSRLRFGLMDLRKWVRRQ